LGGAKETFPIKLHFMLETVQLSNQKTIVNWHPHGRSFKVFDRKRFEEEVLPKFFRYQSEYLSFQRQLNVYGFLRTVGQGRDHNSYYHPMLLRGKPELATLIQRHKCAPDTKRRTFDPTTEPDFYSMAPLPRPLAHLGHSSGPYEPMPAQSLNARTEAHGAPLTPFRSILDHSSEAPFHANQPYRSVGEQLRQPVPLNGNNLRVQPFTGLTYQGPESANLQLDPVPSFSEVPLTRVSLPSLEFTANGLPTPLTHRLHGTISTFCASGGDVALLHQSMDQSSNFNNFNLTTLLASRAASNYALPHSTQNQAATDDRAAEPESKRLRLGFHQDHLDHTPTVSQGYQPTQDSSQDAANDESCAWIETTDFNTFW
jgi:HSF-type DNA-binding